VRIGYGIRGIQNPSGRILETVIERTYPEMRVELLTTDGSVENTQALQRDEAEFVLTVADVAYLGYIGQLPRSTQRLDKLRGVATLATLPLQVIVRRGMRTSAIGDLKGARVGIGPVGSACPLTADLLLRAHGLSVDDLQVETIPFDEASRELTAGDLDASFVCEGSPFASVASALAAGARVLELSGPRIERLRMEYPFLRLVVMKKGTYGTTPAFRTIGVDGLIATRSTLDEASVYKLTKAFYLALPQLHTQLDPTRAAATSVPLHPGAARYYRELENIHGDRRTRSDRFAVRSRRTPGAAPRLPYSSSAPAPQSLR
jgi:TRAP transporter TAXI family solute receptor